MSAWRPPDRHTLHEEMRIEADPTRLRSAAAGLGRLTTDLRAALAALSGLANAATLDAGPAGRAFESMWAAWSSALPELAGRLEVTAAALRLAADRYAAVDEQSIPPPDR